MSRERARPARTVPRGERCRPSNRQSSRRLLQPRVEKLTHPLQLVGLQFPPRDQLREQQLGGSGKDFVCNSVQGGLSGRGAVHKGRVAVRLPFLAVPDITLCLERAQNGKHRRIRKVLLESLANFGNRRRALVPEDG